MAGARRAVAPGPDGGRPAGRSGVLRSAAGRSAAGRSAVWWSALARWGLWVVVLVAAVGALVIGSGRHTTQTLAQRTLAVAGQVRCPICSGESAANSQVAEAVAIRAQIREELAAGRPTDRVLADLVDVYGTGILEKPQARGIGVVVWVVPVVAVVAAAAALVLAFARWRRGAPGAANAAASRPEDDAIVAAALARDSAGDVP